MPSAFSHCPLKPSEGDVSAASLTQNAASRGENRSNPHLTLKGWCLIRLQLPGQVSQEHRLVEIALADVLWVSSVADLSGVFAMKGVKLTARSLSFAISDSKGSSVPNHQPFLWKEKDSYTAIED